MHLGWIQDLNMCGCDQVTITDAAFVHLRGIQSLDMRLCNQATITDAAFEHLRRIQTLEMGSCNQATIMDAAFVHRNPTRSTCTAEPGDNHSRSLVHLRGIRSLRTSYCSAAMMTAATALLVGPKP